MGLYIQAMGFIHSSNSSYIPKVRLYKTYASYKYVKILISIYVGNFILNINSSMTYVSNTIFGQGNPISNPLDNTYIFFWYDTHGLGTKDQAPMPSFHFFSVIYLFLFRSLGLRWCRISPSQPYLFLFSFLLILSFLAERVWDRTPTTPFNFFLKFLLFCLEVVGLIPTRLNLLFFF